jgi:Zn-dependent peptidase ImmA (M78 family)/DNA-binding XRE family transcriptional regulator
MTTIMNPTINGDRLKQAREIRGFTQAELAERVGVTQSTIAQLESNNKQLILQPSERIIEAIAFQTGFSVAYFYQESPPEFPLGSLLFRSRRSLLKREDKARVHQLGSLIYEIAEKMAKRVKTIPTTVPRVGSEDPATAAHITRAAFGLSPHTPVRNLLNILEKNGVFIFAIPLSVEEHDSYSVWADTQLRRPVIMISSGKPGDRQRFSLAHELGHLVMHDTFPEGLKKIEDEADRFASEFLLPEEAMRSAIEPPVTLTSLAELKPRWGVSIASLIVRSRQLRIITERQAKYLHQQMRAQEWDKTEPENLNINAEKPRAFKRMAEILYGVPIDAAKVAAFNLAPVNLVKMILDAHADKPNSLRAETKREGEKPSNVVALRSKR